MNIENYKDLELLAKEYNLPVEDVLFIALNRYGVNMDCEDNRIRFYLTLNTLKEEFFFAVCVNTCPTPFTIKDKKLYLSNQEIGSLSRIEKDTCTSTYFRCGKRAMTVNSNSRSKCAGCKFCGTYKLDSDEDENLTTKEELLNYYKKIMKENGLTDLSDMFQITVCTGCFENEQRLVDHLIFLKKTLGEIGFKGKINYIGSQLRSKEQLERIKNEIGTFSIFLTVERFTEREKFMRPEKASLTIEKAIEIAKECKRLGFIVSFLYILGLEDLQVFEKHTRELAPYLTKFPDVQIYQDYTCEQENYRCEDAKDFRYYLEARKILENIFGDSVLKPESWENYRSLFYTTYKGKKHDGVRK